MESTIVALRLSKAALTRYSSEAQACRIPLGTYLRQCLEELERLITDVELPMIALQYAATPMEGPAAAMPASDLGTIVGALRLLRLAATRSPEA